MKQLVLIYFLMVANILAQGTKPPVTSLSGLSDVLISSPASGQALTYDGVSKWKNVAVPGGSLATLSDVSLTGVPANLQLLQYSTGTSKWMAYGPLAFSDITGNVAVSQLNSGTGASATTYWRGDNTWGSPPVGGVAVTNNLLVGDNSGNAVPSTLLLAQNSGSTVSVSTSVNSGDGAMKVYNVGLSGGATSSVLLSGQAVDPGATLRYYEGAYPTTGMIQNTDVSLNSAQGRLLISGKNNILFSNDGPLLATERMRLGNGLMIGTTTDKGGGTANVTGGFYVNGNKIGGVATLSSTVDQTATTETVHLSYTVPANTVQVGTTFRISAWGNMDNPASAITYTPRIRWGGTGGALLMATPAITSSTTAGTNRDWEIDARVTVRSLGSLAGTCVATLHEGNHMINALPTYFADVATSGATAIGIDTTINRDICLTWTLSTATGTPHVRTIGGIIEIVEP